MSEVKEFLEALEAVERYILYLEIRSVGHIYFGWAFGALIMGLFGFFSKPLEKITGVPSSLIFIFVGIIVSIIVFVLSDKGFAAARRLKISRAPPEKRGEIIAKVRKFNIMTALIWSLTSIIFFSICFSFKRFSYYYFMVSLLSTLGFGNLAMSLVHRWLLEELIVESFWVGVFLLISTLITLTLIFFGLFYASSIFSILSIFVIYLVAGLYAYSKAFKVLEGK